MNLPNRSIERTFTLFSCALSIFSTAAAQDICTPYVEQTVQPVKPNVLWKQLANVPTVKSEYETTAAFEARVASTMSKIASPVVVEVPVQGKYITYDADSSRLNVQGYAFANERTEYSGVFGYGSPLYQKIKYGYSDNIDVVFPYEEAQVGSYVGTTAMGVKIRVTKVRRFTRVLFEREGKLAEGLFPGLSQHDAPVITFSNVTPEMAKHMKATFRAAILYTPKPPYFAKGKYPWGEPTIEGPMDIDETIEVAIGDIQCALLLNSDGKVYGATATR